MEDKDRKKRNLFGGEEPEKEVPVPSEESKFFETVQEEKTTVTCPWHNLPLQIETENYFDEESKTTALKRFAVCRCRVEDNTHRGQRAWEQT